MNLNNTNDALSASQPQAGTENVTLTGEIDHIRYEAEDGSFSIIYVKDSQGNRFCVIGGIAGAVKGQTVTVKGKWEFHKDYGRQLRADEWTFELPATREGIERYLASGIITGIGRRTAKKIVDVFGLETLSILDSAPQRLSEIPRFGRKKIEKISEAWKQNSEKREMRVFMEGLGITPAYFSRIYKAYGDTAPQIMKTNPYRLASEVDGIGFRMADKIGEKLAIGRNDVKRLVAGVGYTLDTMKAAGHACVPREELVKKVAEMLDVTPADAENAVAAAVNTKKAVTETTYDGREMIYEPYMKACEDELPKMILSLLNVKNHAGEKMADVPPENITKFSEEQLFAVSAAARSPLSIITGGPGVGKTTVISEIVRRAQKAGLSFALAAPTGRAAKRMGEATGVTASTIHRLLKWDPVKKGFVHDRKNPLEQSLVIVDESSMLDIPTALALFRAVKPASTLVLTGDPDQLPSVGPGNVLNDLISSEICPVSRLTKIFRQGAGSGIITAAHDVNSGIMPKIAKPPKDGLCDFYWIEKESQEDAADIIERMIAERIPERFGLDPVRDIQYLTPMNRGLTGTAAMNERFQKILNPENEKIFRSGGRIFKLGDKIMQTSNNYDKGVFNGDMGFICEIDAVNESFSVTFDTAKVDYTFDDASQITCAYAVTVHKSQGSEFPAVVMALLPQHYMMLQRNLLYTAITRAKQLMILVGSRKAVSMAVRNYTREERCSMLHDKLEMMKGR